MYKLQKLVRESLKENSISELSAKTNVDPNVLTKIVKGHRKFKIMILERLYGFYKIPRDDLFRENLQKGLVPSESVIGTLLRIKRIEKAYTLEEVARLIKGDKRNLIRIELGETLPSQNSDTINRLMDLYELSEDEKERIRFYIALLKDIVKITKEHDIFDYFSKSNKGHGK